MTFIQLTMFLAVCEYNSITRASEYLHISQPALTIAIKQLEEEFGVSLFYRDRKRMVLTAKGVEFQKMAAVIADNVASLEGSMKLLTKKPNRIRIGIPDRVGVHLCPDLIADFHTHYPEVYIKLHVGSSTDSLQLLRDGKIEAAIVVGSEDIDSRCDYLPLFNLSIIGYCRSDHPLAGKTGVTPEQLSAERIILNGVSSKWAVSGSAELLISRFHDAKIRPDILTYTTQIPLAMRLIQQFNAIAFLSEELMGLYENISQFTPDFSVERHLVLTWRKDLPKSKQLEDFVDFVRERVVPPDKSDTKPL